MSEDAPRLAVAEPRGPRARVVVAVDPVAADRLREIARGRTLAIDFFTARCCTSVLVGDLTVRWLDVVGPPSAGPAAAPLPDGFVGLAPFEDVALAADERLIDLLERAGPTIVMSGPVFARHLAVQLDDATAWLDFLETPVAYRPHRHPRPAR